MVLYLIVGGGWVLVLVEEEIVGLGLVVVNDVLFKLLLVELQL